MSLARGPAGSIGRAAACLLALWLGWVSAAFGQSEVPVPKLASRVTDLTGTLSAEARSQLEAQLAAIEQRKGSQVAVLIVPTTAPEPIESYSIRVVEAWKLGRATVGTQRVDDGVLLLVAKNDRKLRIEVGRGLEGAIPDAYAKRIIAESIAPRFKQGDFAGGIAAGVTEIGRLIDGEKLPAPWQGAHPEGGGSGADDDAWILYLVFAVVGGLIAAKVIGRFLASIATGSGMGVYAALHGQPLLVAAVIGIGLFLAVLFLASLRGGLSSAAGPQRRGGRSGAVWTTGGGGWGGGSSSSSDGGFSGGGGDFGGGGASGDW